MTIANIHTALAQAFDDADLALPVVFENTGSYKPTPGTPWCEFFFIPNEPQVLTLGENGEDEHTGIVQINLNYPLNQGPVPALQKAGEIRSVFKAGATFTYQSQSVLIRGAGVSRASQVVNSHYQVILTINWRSITTR